MGTATSGGAVSATPSRAYARRVFALVALTLVSIAAFAVAPFSWGGALYLITIWIHMALFATAPFRRQVRPRHAWWWMTVAGAVLPIAVTLSALQVQATVTGAKVSDILYYVAYGAIGVWLFLLSRSVHARRDINSLLDGIAAALGVGLALWATVLHWMAAGVPQQGSLTWVLFPTFVVTVLVIAFHLYGRLGRRVIPLTILAVALLLQVAFDLVYAAIATFAPNTTIVSLFSVYLLPCLGFALASIHPDLPEMGRAPNDATARRHFSGHAWLTFVALSPVVIASATPTSGGIDKLVRTALVSALLMLLFVRLALSLRRVSAAEAAASHRASHDPMTGLLNRSAMIDILTQRLHENARDERLTAVLFLDCDDFKHVNDTWGHEAGDTLLRDIAVRIPRQLRGDEVLTRHGGDEFVIVASVDTPDGAVELAQRVRACFDAPLQILPGRAHTITPSIGAAVSSPGELATTDELLRRADVAMYEAKRRGRGLSVLFEGELADLSRHRADAGDRLADAIRTGAIKAELEPIMAGPDFTRHVGWEAVPRWHDPQIGDVAPTLFVPIAEHLGLMDELGELLLRQACEQAVKIRRVRPEADLALSVDVCPAQLRSPEYAARVLATIGEVGLPPGSLHLEIAETTLVDGARLIRGTLDQLCEAGVQLCIGEFGAGYASISTLQRLPISCVKLDRTLIPRRAAEEEAVRQLRAVIALLRALGVMGIVAEGVDTAEQADILASVGCPMAQGAFISLPPGSDSVKGELVTP